MRNRDQQSQKAPEVGWLNPPDTPWPVPVLDLRPLALGYTSASGNPVCAANAVSYGQDDGMGFIGVKPQITRLVDVNLAFNIDGILADGALFIPQVMEHKWVLYYHNNQIIFIRSWLKQVFALADCQIVDGRLQITKLQGAFLAEDEEDDFSVRILDFLIRSHALDMVHPAPFPDELAKNPREAAMWCISSYGNRALFATHHKFESPLPERPLRTYSLLHTSVARADSEKIAVLLKQGLPADLLDRDGQSPLHWALVREGTDMIELMLGYGSSIDIRATDGSTPLMHAVRYQSPEKVKSLLERGANPNILDNRGFTALHTAAYLGLAQIVELLLQHGASLEIIAEGQTPISLAKTHGRHAVLAILERAKNA